MIKVVYVPLDERMCNYQYPQRLAAMSSSVELLVPPYEKMGCHKKPADRDWIWEWLFENAADCEYAILSVDTLVYGNIINSRIHHRSIEECKRTLEGFRLLKCRYPYLKIHAFNLVARVAAYDSAQEDPGYWATQGRNIWIYTCLMDKISRNLASDDEKQQFEALKEEIPRDNLDDFLKRREVDRFTNLVCVDLVKEGVFDHLTIPKDDTAEYGYAAMDQWAIAKKVRENNLMNKVMVYPGADEVGCVLFARFFNLINEYTPKVYVRYSSTLGPTIVPKYEDRPLHEGIKAQITSAGGILEDNPRLADCMLAVNSPGTHMIESMEQYDKDITFSSHINMHEFLRYILYYKQTYKKPVGLAEVSVVNGCENEFMQLALMTGALEAVDGVGGWNTAQNTIGVVLAQIILVSFKPDPGEIVQKRMDEFTIGSIVSDWLFQSNILHSFLWETKDKIDPYSLKDEYGETVAYVKNGLRHLIEERFHGLYKGRQIVLERLSFHWDGVFYIDLLVGLQELDTDGQQKNALNKEAPGRDI